MKKKAIEIIKDLIISILLVACIAIILSIVFYEKISLSKVIPESEEYVLPEEMEEELKNKNIEEVEEVIVNYYIDAKDLKKYEKTKEYDKGKVNPFAIESSSPTDSDKNENQSSNSIQDSNNGFYEDDGTK